MAGITRLIAWFSGNTLLLITLYLVYSPFPVYATENGVDGSGVELKYGGKAVSPGYENKTDGEEWERCSTKFSEDIYDIDFCNADYGCTVGIVTFVYEHGEWRKVEQPPVHLWCVECVGPNDVWAGTDTGDIYHFTGFN